MKKKHVLYDLKSKKFYKLLFKKHPLYVFISFLSTSNFEISVELLTSINFVLFILFLLIGYCLYILEWN